MLRLMAGVLDDEQAADSEVESRDMAGIPESLTKGTTVEAVPGVLYTSPSRSARAAEVVLLLPSACTKPKRMLLMVNQNKMLSSLLQACFWKDIGREMLQASPNGLSAL